jgi:hypothetical protein
MNFRIFIPALLVFMTCAACEKADQAIDAINKAKTLKDDIQKKAQEVTDDIKGKANQIVGGFTKNTSKKPTDGKDKESRKGKGEYEDREDH